MKVWTAAVLAVALGCAATAAEAQPKGKSRNQPPPPAAVVVAPAVPAGPPAEPLGAAVQSYASFQNDISDLMNQNVGNAAELDMVMERAAAQNREALMRGWIAYGAMVAAQQPEFVRGVRETAAHYGAAGFIRGLTLDPGYAQVLRGGPAAAQLALLAAKADGDRIYHVGERYKEMAYGLQNQRWANQVAPQQPARVLRMKTLAQTAAGRNIGPAFTPRLTPAAGSVAPWTDANQFGGSSFWDGLRITPLTVAQQIAAPTYTVRTNSDRIGAVNRMTTLAALYILGATQDPAAQADRLLTEGSTANCLELAQVQFYQCLSAARFRYENAFCLGEHALKDMGNCVRGAATVDGLAMSTPVAGIPVISASPSH